MTVAGSGKVQGGVNAPHFETWGQQLPIGCGLLGLLNKQIHRPKILEYQPPEPKIPFRFLFFFFSFVRLPRQ